METQYKRKLNRSYMILYGETKIPEYQLAMLQSTKPEGLLPVQVIQGPEMAQYHYDITGYQSLDQILQGNPLRGELLECILSRLVRTMEQLSSHLLEEERILLSPNYIFYNARQQQIGYCYCLAQEKEKNGTIKELMEYLLAHLDHNDTQAVKMAYELYQSVVEEQGNLSEMLHEARMHKEEPLVSTSISGLEEKREKTQEPVAIQERIRFYDSTMLQQNTQNGYEQENERETAGEFLTRNMGWNNMAQSSLQRSRTGEVGQKMVAEQITYQSDCEKKERKKAKIHLPLFAPFSKKRARRTESARTKFRHKPVQEQSYLFEPTDMLPQQEEQHTVYLGTREEKQPCRLQYEGEGDERDLLLDREVYLIGSRPSEVDGLLHANTISRMHAQITKMPDGYYLEDLNSMNGTTINGRMLDYKERVRLHPRDEICFASERFRFLS